MDQKPQRRESRMWRIELTRFDEFARGGDDVRMVRTDDAVQLGALFFTAFKGTTDDLQQTEADYRAKANALFEGLYGDCILAASSVVERDGELLSACVVTGYEPYDCPLIAIEATRPSMQGNGIARRLVKASLRNLVIAGHSACRAMITVGNGPSERLFERCGFVPRDIAPPGCGQ
ncbi:MULTISPECIES: GNAT family N-acetyltransferase [Paraburkholderia]|uniref:GNAT family N-acetyltransferase n=1 Tax=Paraburkholderia madseniana TaxID=2599607 RepID=A0AAP5BK03_9BURK|nr:MULTISPECIES: GNAT family N-acetyltransferase [Paraburkholderia]MCX4150111.1 GNAT family N-acetyltransferase [Paraburkholderia madseniana]MDN7153045.1 GNAT family N-acetyltransferase [Paraburkholderia sp. WS6]MDQ6411927.1 GNAT family N-acetyltransferase [Paraburkholderia madseniana]